MSSNAETTTVRTLISKWSDRDAKTLYMFTELVEYENGARDAVKSETGDEAWANRIAEHYKLKMPEAKDE